MITSLVPTPTQAQPQPQPIYSPTLLPSSCTPPEEVQQVQSPPSSSSSSSYPSPLLLPPAQSKTTYTTHTATIGSRARAYNKDMSGSMNPEGKPWCARSDPRMNRAVEARLQNPNLSLYECLCMGGFNYAADEAHALDSENVTLTQRKNQLNRRLRSYRKRLSKAQEAKKQESSEQQHHGHGLVPKQLQVQGQEAVGAGGAVAATGGHQEIISGLGTLGLAQPQGQQQQQQPISAAPGAAATARITHPQVSNHNDVTNYLINMPMEEGGGGGGIGGLQGRGGGGSGAHGGSGSHTSTPTHRNHHHQPQIQVAATTGGGGEDNHSTTSSLIGAIDNFIRSDSSLSSPLFLYNNNDTTTSIHNHQGPAAGGGIVLPLPREHPIAIGAAATSSTALQEAKDSSNDYDQGGNNNNNIITSLADALHQQATAQATGGPHHHAATTNIGVHLQSPIAAGSSTITTHPIQAHHQQPAGTSTGAAQDLALSLLSNWEALTGQSRPSVSASQPVLPPQNASNSMQAIYTSLPAAVIASGGAAAAGNASGQQQQQQQQQQQLPQAPPGQHATQLAIVGHQPLQQQQQQSVNTAGASITIDGLEQLLHQATGTTTQGHGTTATAAAASQGQQGQGLPAMLSESIIQLALQGQIPMNLLTGAVQASQASAASTNTAPDPPQMPTRQPQQPPASSNSSVTATAPAAAAVNDPRQELALRLFEQEMQTMYERIMRNVGYGQEEIQNTSQSYRNFLQVANQREYERVRGLLGIATMTTSSSGGPAPAPSNHHHQRSHPGASGGNIT